VDAVDDDSRQRLGELADQLDELLAGRSSSPELADLILLADGLTEVLLHEVACARARSDG
jgi:hypothetical protein